MTNIFDPAVVAKLSPEVRKALILEVKRKLEENKLADYKPYPKQKEFHAQGARYRERLFKAANQSGKTLSAGAEAAMHLTGRYPDWWEGKVFERATQGIAASETSLLTRDGVQKMLLGAPAWPLGTGYIPKSCIIGEPVRSRHGAPDAYEYCRVRHVTGDDSIVYFRSYDQGRARVQSMTLDWAWMDEECDIDFYMEILTRTNVVMGPVFMTFTPLKGYTETVNRFLQEKMPGTAVTTMTLYDAEHYSDADRESIIASYPSHERDARVMGEPALGSGKVFPIDIETIKEDPQVIPNHWARLAAIDFGWDHPTAVVWGAHDRDTDIVHIYDAYKLREATPPIHAAAINARGKWIPVAWPHDGLQTEKGSGHQLSEIYKELGVNMMNERAQYRESPDGTEASRSSVEAGIQDLLIRMQTNRLKIARHLNDLFGEILVYHRKDGKVVKVGEDLISAMRYLIMSLDYAETPPIAIQNTWRDRAYDWRA